MRYLLHLFLRAICWLDLAAYTLALLLLALLPSGWLRICYPKLFRSWCRCFVRALGVRLHLHQHQTRPLPDHFILIANHPSALELVGIPGLFNVVSLAKIEVRDWWFVGRIAAAAGTFFVERESKGSRQNALTSMRSAVSGGRNIAIYPEGGCKGRRVAERFHYGAFTLSLDTGVPIVPVFLHYEAQQAFAWEGQTLPQMLRQIACAPNRQAHYHVYDAFDPADFADRDAYVQHVHACYLTWQQRHLD
ncbi:lysophospholipid acyltransferase family protein [Jeongeupia naejangsanensis]|uniref:1-acyl-sn-glycerol-3-phosphate acyltransferase n=1 Tax=Jeongeupia naejangsanensis TaxID=613195 RepID=A0ABS2BKQ4_9NEIS|nr:lysophospholipid acyltransferase family protein [Jeongeupia naejangsanensis]MBM3116186.1 1-acyl-sn-glycerol-3-phosphate acyltransferase [Jeongeupia naejangsanensis]